MNKSALGALIGFILFALGLTSVFLNMTGLQFAFMAFLEQLPGIASFLINIGLIISGGIIMYLSITDWRNA
jgi:hypothetical protein